MSNLEKIRRIPFSNPSDPSAFFEVVKLEELLARQMDHDVSKNHIVKFYIILAIEGGIGKHTIDFIDYEYQKGSVLLIRKDQIHRFHRFPNVRGYLLIFTDEFIVSHLNSMQANKSLQLFNEVLNYPKIEMADRQDIFNDFLTLIRHIDVEYNVRDDYSLGITRSALHILITKLFRIQSTGGQILKESKHLEEFIAFQQLIELQCFESRKVKDYALQLGCSTKKLNIIVQSLVNKSAKTFIDEVAITQIKRLLISTNDSVKEIAYTAGFSDSTNLYKYFKKYVGISPEAFRRSHT